MPKKQKPEFNRVWIELEQPVDDSHAMEVCAMANNMLQRLSSVPLADRFGWDSKRKQFTYGGPMGYRGLTDRGEWFDLEYLGRPFGADHPT